MEFAGRGFCRPDHAGIMIFMRRRFVIQLHATGGGHHHDLMLDAGEALETWRLNRLPVRLGPHESIPAAALPAHRRAYLTYQGPVKGGRGAVRIVEAGDCRVLARNEAFWLVELVGARLRGTFTLRHLAPGRWALSAARRRSARCGASASPR